MSKVVDFDTAQLHLATPWGLTPVEFHRDLWRQNTTASELSCSVVCMILCLAILVEHRLVTDRQTQGHSTYRTSIASHGKNLCLCRHELGLTETLLSLSPSRGCSILRSAWKPALMLCMRRRSLLLAISRRALRSLLSRGT